MWITNKKIHYKASERLFTKSSYFEIFYTSCLCQDWPDGYTYYDLYPSQIPLSRCNIYVCMAQKIVLEPFAAQNEDKSNKVCEFRVSIICH